MVGSISLGFKTAHNLGFETISPRASNLGFGSITQRAALGCRPDFVGPGARTRADSWIGGSLILGFIYHPLFTASVG